MQQIKQIAITAILDMLNNKMKIILSTPYFFPHSFGGGQTYVYKLAKELQKRGHIISVLTTSPWIKRPDRYVIEPYEYQSIKVVGVRINPFFISAGDLILGSNSVLSEVLERVIADQKPDLVHINGIKEALIRTCNSVNIPYVVSAHHPGFACPVGTLLRPDDSLCSYAASDEVCVPCSCMHKRHGAVGWILGHVPGWVYRSIGRFLNKFRNITFLGRGIQYPWLVEKRIEGQRILLHESRAIIAPSAAIRELLVRNGVTGDRIISLPHGIAPLTVLPFDEIKGRRIRFGYIGSIGYAKGVHVLLRALKELDSDKVELHVFGEAQNRWDKRYLDVYLEKYGGRAEIHFHGRISQEDILEAYRAIDVLILPSIYLEVFGLVILEAFSAGRPVVVTRSGGPTELVRDGVDGFVVERNDSVSLALAMRKFVEAPHLIAEMAGNIKPVMTIHEYVDEIEGVYNKIMGNLSA